MSEMLALVAQTTDLRSVVLDIETGNAASIRIAQRVGARRRTPERTVIDRRGAPQRMAVFVVDLRG